jgi:hypothetical protein
VAEAVDANSRIDVAGIENLSKHLVHVLGPRAPRP